MKSVIMTTLLIVACVTVVGAFVAYLRMTKEIETECMQKWNTPADQLACIQLRTKSAIP